MNFDYEKNSRKKAFLVISNHQYHISECGEHHYRANNEKNGDYYEYPSLSHFMGEH